VISVDTLIVAVAPKPPAKHLREDDDEEEEEEELVESSHFISERFVVFSIF
jgi:hypothetical protein